MADFLSLACELDESLSLEELESEPLDDELDEEEAELLAEEEEVELACRHAQIRLNSLAVRCTNLFLSGHFQWSSRQSAYKHAHNLNAGPAASGGR